MKSSPVSSLRRLAPVLAACVLVFGSHASEVADASRRAPAPPPRKAAPPQKATDTQRQPIPATQAFGQVNGESVNIRMGPGTQHAAVGAMRTGDFVKARAKQNGWLEIDWPASLPAWIEKNDVRLTTRTGSEQMAIVADGTSKVYCQGSNKSAVLASLSKGAPVEILGEQGAWYKVKAPPTAIAYISAKYVVTGVSQPEKPVATIAKNAAPATSIPASVPTNAPAKIEAAVASRKVTTEVKRAAPLDTPTAPPPASKAVLPAPVAPAAIAPEEPKAVIATEKVKPIPAPTAEEIAKAKELEEFANAPALEAEELPALESLLTTPSLSAILDEYASLPTAPTESALPQIDPATELKQVLDTLHAPAPDEAKPVAEVKAPEAASAPAAELKAVLDAKPTAEVKPVAEVQNDLAKVIEETRQSIRQEEPKRSVIDDNLQALETARLASEKRRRADEENQRASLTAALKQFEALETRKRAEPAAPIDLGIDARTGVFLAPPEPAAPEKTDKVQADLQQVFEADQRKAALEREQSNWADAIRKSEELRAKAPLDSANFNNALLEAEETQNLARLAEEDTQRMNTENERAQGIQKQIEALMKAAPVAPSLVQEVPTVTEKKIEPTHIVAEQDILQTLENARKNLETNKRAETVLPDAPEETAKPKMEAPQTIPVSQDEKYGIFMDPSEAPKAKKPVEEIRALMFPTEPVGEPMSSRIPDIGRMPRTEELAPQAAVTDSAKVVDLNVAPAEPVSATPALNFEEKGIEVIAEPEGSIQEDTFREANKRVKNKFVVPGNAPAPFGRRAEVIKLD